MGVKIQDIIVARDQPDINPCWLNGSIFISGLDSGGSNRFSNNLWDDDNLDIGQQLDTADLESAL